MLRRHREINFEERVEIDYNHTESDNELENTNIIENEEGISDQVYIDQKFLLSLHADHCISERGLQTVVENARDLVSSHLLTFRKKVETALTNRGHDASFVKDLAVTNNLIEISSKHMHYKFLEDHCGLIRSVPVLMGEKLHQVRGNIRRLKTYGYIVPFQKNLEKLISMPQVWYWLTTSHCSNDGIMRDFCDASYMKDLVRNRVVNRKLKKTVRHSV
jgi:hypothetical protein